MKTKLNTQQQRILLAYEQQHTKMYHINSPVNVYYSFFIFFVFFLQSHLLLKFISLHTFGILFSLSEISIFGIIACIFVAHLSFHFIFEATLCYSTVEMWISRHSFWFIFSKTDVNEYQNKCVYYFNYKSNWTHRSFDRSS